jgi:hypothetical protein
MSFKYIVTRTKKWIVAETETETEKLSWFVLSVSKKHHSPDVGKFGFPPHRFDKNSQQQLKIECRWLDSNLYPLRTY